MIKKLKRFVQIMMEKGCNVQKIREVYLEMLTTEEMLDEVLAFLDNNPTASENDTNFEIHRIYLRTCGIDL